MKCISQSMLKYLVMAFLLLLQACASVPQYGVSVDSISAPGMESKTRYVLRSGTKDVDENDLQYREYAGYIERALALNGYIRVADTAAADMVVFTGYGIGDPETRQYTYSLPVYGATGGSTSSTYGTVSGFGNHAIHSSTTTTTPTYGITGFTTHSGTATTYTRYIWLDAIDLDGYRRTKKDVRLWKTTITSTGYGSDLRRVFPILLGASSPYIGRSTGRRIDIMLTENDKRVLSVKGLDN